MGIANDISPRKKHAIPPELDGFGASVDADTHHKQTRAPHQKNKNMDENPADSIFTSKHRDDDFFAPAKIKSGKKDLTQTATSKTVSPRTSFSWRQAFRNLIVISIIVLISILIYQNFSQIKAVISGKSVVKTPDDTSSVTIVPQDYTSSVSSSSSTAAPSTTSTPTTAPASTAAESQPAATTAPNKSAVTISLQNGNGINNTAATYQTILSKAGYTVSAIGNASNYKYWSTYIYYKSGLQSTAEDLKKVLARKSTLLKQDEVITKNYDVVIIIGSH